MNLQDLENMGIGIHDVRDQLKQLVYARSVEAFAAGDQARDAINASQLEERKNWLREQFIEKVGGLPSMDTPLLPEITGTIRCEGYRIENVIFQSRQETYVTGSVYVPDDASSPRGAVVFVCGHYSEGRLHPNYQRVCQYMVEAGLVVLAMDPIGQGERWSYYDSELKTTLVDPAVAEHEMAGAQSWPLGDGLARYFLHDIMRSVDYLISRPEVDPAKIGITGNSGGGLQTSMAMLCEPRIAAAAPTTFIMSRETYIFSGQAQDAEQIWPGMSRLGFDHEDLLLAMVPKPVLILAAQYDFFPIEGARRTVERTRRFWEELGHSANIELFEDACEHQYSVPMAKAAASFFAKHLLDKVVHLDDVIISPQEESALWSTASGQVRGDYTAARAAYEENNERLNILESSRGSISEVERIEAAKAWLEKKIMDERKPFDFNPRFADLGTMEGLEVRTCLWWSQEKLFNHAYLFRNAVEGQLNQSGQQITIAVWEKGTKQLEAHLSWIRETCSAGHTVMVLDVSGEGNLEPAAISGIGLYERFGTIHKLTTDLIWLDDSIAALRSYDLLRAAEMAATFMSLDQQDIQVEVYAEGKFALYALLAKLVDPSKRISKVTVGKESGSIGEWVKSRYYDNYNVMATILPGILKYCDIPDLVRWTDATILAKQEA
ncbi:alpha/beta hydrolase family protein [Paenibacillus eucommiae]|uniref:Acetyl xylan esterase domain-containing protein n=1 Tax=Paenibacillus eucommiae TaxID=1355755 RepID=A0ABS4ITF9_9BACL|nr:acetylxylan esterase [Paenibacillus eucommiae]MBP1990849.1 hypothetical protein [Paenibacillus eucommiae]